LTVALKVGGKSAPLEQAVSKPKIENGVVVRPGGNVYWAVGGPAGAGFGVKVPALADVLPTEVELAGTKITLKHSIRERDQKKTAAAHGVTVTVDGATKTAKVVLTDHGNGTWQVTAAVFGNGKAAGGGGVKTDLFS